ncbi:oxygenase MpaB family protein [Mycobacterium kyogaense]|uniref:oxygenase MpaB family protein n=1 Tax=Mycobacterium kyogaense TaxID=2212479 RepID=UPI001F09E7E7|nr:oxygenase MpaB family protein [Mycobacterium kyogaense]
MAVQDSRTTSPSGGAKGGAPGGAKPDEGMLGLGLLAGPANVIMQLARPGVGYGVLESRVDSGRVDLHPIKRARTTFTYLAVSTSGTDAQKDAFRRAVNRAHAQVYSLEDSPVSYNAFDKDLQLWVGACLYKGVLDVYRLFVGEVDADTEARLFEQGRKLGTMLQVPEDMWPADPAAFDRYWQESLDKVHIDDTVRDYLYPIAVSRVRGVRLPGPLQRRAEQTALLITTGFLPQRFRDEMQLEWNAKQQRRFDRIIRVLRAVNTCSPRVVREFPFNVLLKDVDRRIRTGRPLV